MTEFLTTSTGRKLAYNRTLGSGRGAKGPGVVFLGGFKSDMMGSKAIYLEERARATGRAFLRFDYSGHGQSSESFEAGAIGDWAADAREIIETLTEGPQVLVGSSMGGWISLLLSRQIPKRIHGLVGIAAAPDFTARLWDSLSADQQANVKATGRLEEPSEYSDEPYVFTHRLFEDGAQNLVLTQPLPLPFAARFLQGTADSDVPVDVALAILNHASGADIRLNLVKGADHRFSTPQCLDLIGQSIAEVLGEDF